MRQFHLNSVVAWQRRPSSHSHGERETSICATQTLYKTLQGEGQAPISHMEPRVPGDGPEWTEAFQAVHRQ
jgi:hypothetical protein